MSVIGPDFVPWMRQQVGEWSDKYDVNARRAFPAWALHFLFDVDDDDAFNQTNTLTQGDAGLDGWYHDRVEGVFHLVQAKYLDDPVDGVVASGELDPLLRAALLLQSPAEIEDGAHGIKLTPIALELEQALLDDAAVSLDFITAGRVGDQTRNELEDAVRKLGAKFSATFIDTERLWNLHVDDEPIPDLKGKSFPFRMAGPSEFFERDNDDIAGVKKVVVAAIDGRSLADIVDNAGARIFQKNVRYYLSKSNKVNKAMRTTLESDQGRHAFWLYNNGITIIADSFDIKGDNKEMVVEITNPQIVNGAQTSSVLRERRANLQPGDVSIQARIIAVTDDENGKLALQRISEYTNSQSPVRAADLRSNDERHRKIQANFDMLPLPVFYERRRGEWQSLDAASRQRYQSGKDIRKVAKDDIGQRNLAFLGKPAESIAKKDSIFTDLAVEAEAFDPSTSAQVHMLANTLYLHADTLMKTTQRDSLLQLVPALGTPIASEEGSPTQLEALRPARKLVLAYAVALAHEVLKKRYGNIGPHRAEVLRDRLDDSGSGPSDVVWKLVFQTMSLWLSQLVDKSAIKKTLQRPETFSQQIKPALLAQLNFVDLNALLPSIPHAD